MNLADAGYFHLGHNYSQAGRQRLFQSGRYAQAVIRDDRPLPPAFSLAQFRDYPQNQGQAGTCWVNAAVMLAMILANALGFKSFQIARRFVGWWAKQLLEGGGNPANGGMASDALLAMTAEKGKGCCHEALWPYPTPDTSEDEMYRLLAQKPPSAAESDAGQFHIGQIADVQLGPDAQRLIFNGHPFAIGIWWPYNWDTQGETFFNTIGNGKYGHALAVIGYANFGGGIWWQIENSHGPIYAPLPDDHAKNVPGYKPAFADKTHDFWVADSTLRKVIGYGNAELVTAATADGFQPNTRPMTLAEALV